MSASVSTKRPYWNKVQVCRKGDGCICHSFEVNFIGIKHHQSVPAAFHHNERRTYNGFRVGLASAKQTTTSPAFTSLPADPPILPDTEIGIKSLLFRCRVVRVCGAIQRSLRNVSHAIVPIVSLVLNFAAVTLPADPVNMSEVTSEFLPLLFLRSYFKFQSLYQSLCQIPRPLSLYWKIPHKSTASSCILQSKVVPQSCK